MPSHHSLLPQTEDIPAQAGKNDAAVDYPARNAFVIALLKNLQRGHYAPLAWWRFFADAWKQSRRTTREHPDLARSWAYISTLVSALTLGCWCAVWRIEGRHIALPILPALLLCLVLELGDVYVHLGLHYHPDTGSFRKRLGIPTMLTLVRGIMANVLLAHLLSGRIPLTSVVLSAYVIGIATDVADGQIARRSGWLTHLGGYLDSEADLFLSISTVVCALLLGALPIWLALAMLLRFLIPLLGAIFSYFVAIRQIDLNHTVWGRSAGIAQATYLIVLLAPGNFAHPLSFISLPLMLLTLALLGLAAIMDVKKNLVFWKQQKANPINNCKANEAEPVNPASLPVSCLDCAEQRTVLQEQTHLEVARGATARGDEKAWERVRLQQSTPPRH